MIDIIELVTNLFESLDKHFLPFLNRKLKLVEQNFKQDFFKKMLVLHLEENKKILEKIKTQEAIKNVLEKKGDYDTTEQYKEIAKLQNELQENNLKIETIKGKIKND